MSRPTSKESLLELSTENYQKLLILINSFSEQEKIATFPFEDRDRNIRDVVGHLHEWHLMMQTWYELGMQGQKPITPKEGYTWKTLPALNQVIWEKYQTIPLADTIKKLAASHNTIQEMIHRHTDEQLFTKKFYLWTGTTSLGSYFISSTSSHYDWAIKKLKCYKKRITHL